MLEAIRKNSYLKGRCLELLLKRFLQQQRSDAKGCEIYLEAFRLGMQTPELNLMLGRIAEKARFAEQPPSGETMIKGAFESLPEDEKASIKNQIRRERLQKLPLETEKETAKEKPVLSEREVIIQAPVPSKVEKKKIRVTDFSPQESVVMKFARAFKAQWHSLKWVFALLVMIVIAFALIKLIPAKKVEVPTSLEVVSDQPYTIQISAFKDRARAENIIREINRQGLKAYLVVTGDEVPWHQVRLGHFSTIAGARVVAEELKKRKIIRNYFIARFTPGNYIE
jgi:hypothetical protein